MNDANVPPFRFVPDDPIKRPFVTLPVYDKDGKKEMELKIQLYDGEGPTEDLLKWYLTVQKYFAMKPANTASEKFEIIPKCLSEAGSIQNMWATAKDEAIGLEEEDDLAF